MQTERRNYLVGLGRLAVLALCVPAVSAVRCWARDDVWGGWDCTGDQCGYVYDPEYGDPSRDIPPGTEFRDLPEDWVCPICGEPKSGFVPR